MRVDPDTDDTAGLHDAADTLLDELTGRFQVERRDGKELFGPDEALVRTVRLIPRTPAAGPLAVTFLGGPGLVVRLGRWWVEMLPGDSVGAAGEPYAYLHCRVSALVEGGLWERVRRGARGSHFEARLIADDVDEARTGALSTRDARDARREGFAAAVQWAPWPTRA